MLRVLVVVLGSDPIVTSRGFLCQREVTLVYLEGASLDTLLGTMGIERLVALWPSRLLGWPVWIKATARPLIGSCSHDPCDVRGQRGSRFPGRSVAIGDGLYHRDPMVW